MTYPKRIYPRYIPYPATTSAKKTTLERFGVNTDAHKITDEEREIASNFDVGKEINKALEEGIVTPCIDWIEP